METFGPIMDRMTLASAFYLGRCIDIHESSAIGHRMANKKHSSPFIDSVRNAIRVRHYSIRTEEAYVSWIKRFIRFHGMRHPKDLGDAEVVQFLTHLAVDGKVSASTQNQALNALVFMYRFIVERPLGELQNVVRAKKPQKLPVVLDQQEIKNLLARLEEPHWLIACLLYGSGLQLLEAVRLRTKDLDFGHRVLTVRDGKGQKDRVVTLADPLIVPLQRHLLTAA